MSTIVNKRVYAYGEFEDARPGEVGLAIIQAGGIPVVSLDATPDIVFIGSARYVPPAHVLARIVDDGLEMHLGKSFHTLFNRKLDSV
jgi:hypothetical protein